MRRAAVALAVACASCGGQGAPAGPRPQAADLRGAVARVGDLELPASAVAMVARAQNTAPRAALDALVEDALAAKGAAAAGLDRAPPASWDITAALARTVPARLAADAANQGPPTPEELSRIEVVHAVVTRSATLREEDAIGMASAVRQAVLGARSGEEFAKRASAVPHPHARLIVQPFGPFGADGVEPDGTSIDPEFVASAFALRAPLDVSPIVTSPFGWHVIMLVRRSEPSAPTADLVAAVQALRARQALEAVLLERRARAKTDVLLSADSLMERAVTAR